jgi:hypothetical protein
MSNHAAGPYSTQGLRPDFDAKLPDRILILGPEKESGGCTVLATLVTKNYPHVDVARATAALFAAAPEMLAALKLVLSCNDDLMDKVMRNPIKDTLAWRIKVAIAKADPGYFPGFDVAKAEGRP